MVFDSTPVLELKHVSKQFGGEHALSDVSLTLERGEVHCLLGQNGSGKSTLIKVLAGVYVPDGPAEMTIEGQRAHFGSPVQARRMGLRFVHQDLALIEKLSVVDNLALGGSYVGKRWISTRRESRAAMAKLREFGVSGFSVTAPLEHLGISERTMTAIVRAVSQDGTAVVLVCDEPTAALSENEKGSLFKLLRFLKEQGVSILYVTHRLQEVFEIGDKVTVLRDGHNVASSVPVASLDHDDLVATILGRRPEAFYQPTVAAPSSEPVLEVTGLSGERIRDLSMTVHAGEIVGICGLMGSGVEEVLPLMFGARPKAAGTVSMRGQTRPVRRTIDAVKAGLAYVPADRKGLGSFVAWSVMQNVTICSIPAVRPLGLLSRRRERTAATRYIDQFNVVPANPEVRFGALSGGNQQKVVIARTQHSGAKAILLEEPTAGVDVGAKPAIYSALSAVARDDGGAIVMMTSDFEEASAVCDRVLVINEGIAFAWLSGSELTPDNILSASIQSLSTAKASSRA